MKASMDYISRFIADPFGPRQQLTLTLTLTSSGNKWEQCHSRRALGRGSACCSPPLLVITQPARMLSTAPGKGTLCRRAAQAGAGSGGEHGGHAARCSTLSTGTGLQPAAKHQPRL